MKVLFTDEIRKKLAASRVVATVTIENVENAKPLAEARLEGGIRSIEITLRTPAAIDAIQRVTQSFPEMLVMAGTVISTEQVKLVQDVGALCAVAPGMNRKVIEAALDAGLPFAPGIVTPSEIESALEYDCDILKFFPAETSGGLSFLKNMQTPYSHLGLQFIPLGGLNVSNAREYLKESYILAVGGSWIATADAIGAGDWIGIEERAATAAAL
ncbi:MAG: bifunctional 4-hydroxy-2-oxoglutarate aldolase/2-dehydro-3-deoxy-phosphogluconate aldolase [Verrucomicrobiota bacterium]|nr:bifunctional 4-hydroxy-2-oxoglutarate aldolase/2-dehydro-3-deoxy-phosphogluconate aldolase [Verrucomicrobiota bacterium]